MSAGGLLLRLAESANIAVCARALRALDPFFIAIPLMAPARNGLGRHVQAALMKAVFAEKMHRR